MYPLAVGIILSLGLGFMTYSLFNRFSLFRVARGKDFRLDQPIKRTINMVKYALGQKRFFSNWREIKTGLMHAFIFWGFMTVSLRTIMLFAMGFKEDFVLPLFGGFLGMAYGITYNTLEILVCVAITYALYRRIILKPKRVTLSIEGIVILCDLASK